MDPHDTLERLIPDQVHDEDRAGTESLELHRQRYEFAAKELRSGPLLDMACGVGYGTRLIADRRTDLQELTGVDISAEAVEYAKVHYGCERVHYVQQDAMTFDGEPDGFDQSGKSDVGAQPKTFETIVSLETIEHLPDPEAFFARLAGLLAPEGILVASVPVTPSVDLNPHHLHDFTARGFRAMGERNGLIEISCHAQIQRVGLRELWSSDRRFRRENLRPNLPAYYVSHPRALLKRIATTLRHGLANHYLTIAWKKDGGSK